MAVMTPDRLARELNAEAASAKAASQSLRPIYCLYGEETFLIDQALAALVDQSLGDGPRDFNLDVFYAGTGQASDFVDAAEMLPMMSERRVVVIKEIQNFKDKQWEALCPLVDTPISSTVVILTGTKIDQRKKFFKTLDSVGAIVKFDRPDERQIPSWIHETVARNGKRILPDASSLLLQYVGPSLLDLNNEIQKLIQFIGSNEIITEADVKSIVTRTRLESVFNLATAVGTGDRAGALTSLVQLLDQGENEVGVLAMISRHIRILLLTKEAVSDGLVTAQIASRVGVSPYFLNQYIDQSKKWSRPQLEKVHGLLLETDRALKSAPVASHILLENLIVKSCEYLERPA